jgi:hypothetical protein
MRSEFNINLLVMKKWFPLRLGILVALFCIVSDLRAQFTKILMDESFVNNKRNWPIQPDGKPRISIQTGRYVVEYGIDMGVWQSTQSLKEVVWDQLSYAASLYFLSDKAVQNGAGIVFGDVAGKHVCEFVINPDGRFGIFREDAGKSTVLKAFTPSASIRKGVNMENRLRITLRNKVLYCYINDVMVHAENFVPVGSDFGMLVVNDCKVAFDQLQVSREISDSEEQQQLPDPPKPVSVPREEQEQTLSNEPKPIAFYVQNNTGKMIYLMVSYVAATDPLTSRNFIEKYWVLLDKNKSYYIVDTRNLYIYYYAEDATHNFWGKTRYWGGTSRYVTAKGKRYGLREIIMKPEEFVYDSNLDKYKYTLTLTK